MLVHMLHFFHFLRVNNERANKEGNIFSCDVIFDSTDVTQSTWPLPELSPSKFILGNSEMIILVVFSNELA